jgi:hypothetical protein
MAISPRMLAIVQKVAAAEAEHYAALRTKLAKDRLRLLQAKRAQTTKKKPPLSEPPPRPR